MPMLAPILASIIFSPTDMLTHTPARSPPAAQVLIDPGDGIWIVHRFYAHLGMASITLSFANLNNLSICKIFKRLMAVADTGRKANRKRAQNMQVATDDNKMENGTAKSETEKKL